MDQDSLRPKKVSKSRWKAAQSWEAGFWTQLEGERPETSLKHKIAVWLSVRQDEPGDDWNQWWRSQFNDYSFLPHSIPAAIEVGCGPYTNIRLIAERRRIQRIVCSDPLAKTYVTFRDRWLSKAVRKRLVELDTSPAESLLFGDETFNLVVIINVLDHVQDPALCVRSVKRILKPGGYLVIGQDLTNDQDRAAMAQDEMHLAGHTIFLTDAELDQMLDDTDLEKVFIKILPRQAGRYPPYHYATYLMAARKLVG